mmetsp:Transcript_32464/g.103512  ORF Transcript_32464/g.103512 Transcript_32464/m.103512 type:complete len:130 (+) Transcript_32464:183-572(+)
MTSEVETTLRKYLECSQMRKKVASEAKVGGATYAGITFEPRPYSEAELRGVPRNLERYLDDRKFIVVHVPPTVMFKAKCFSPSKLCAIYELDDTKATDVLYTQPSQTTGTLLFDSFNYGDDDEFRDQVL